MKLFKLPTYMFDPDDAGGAGGAIDEGADADTPVTDDKADRNASLKAVADAIRQGFAAAVPAVAVAPAPVVNMGPSQAEIRRALQDEAAQVNDDVDKLFADGKASEAMARRDAFNAKVNQSLAANPNDNVIVRTAVDLGERLAKTEHTAIMSRWGDEVRRAIDAMPVEERVRPNAWDRAVKEVRANHFDEILNESVTTKVEEARKSFVPPPGAGGSRGHRPLTGAASKLTEEQLWGADVTGVSAEDYAKELDREAKFENRPFKERMKFPGVPILDDAPGNQRVQPGKF